MLARALHSALMDDPLSIHPMAPIIIAAPDLSEYKKAEGLASLVLIIT